MDYFAPGLREISRRAGRQWMRMRIRMAQRDLEKAETTLGLLGWQQADFDENTQAQVDRIVEYEREQAKATNDAAAVGRVLREHMEAREAARREHEAERARADERRRQLEEAITAAEAWLEACRREEPTFEGRMPELERELRDCSRRYSELLGMVSHTPATKAEMIGLRERSVQIPNEIASLRIAHLRVTTEVRTLESQLENCRAELAAAEREQAEQEDAFAVADKERETKIHELERERAAFDEAYASLEGAKANPYREVGRVLADNGIAPMNQPQALENVRRRRLVVLEREAALGASLEATAAENPVEIRQSLLLWSGIGVGTVLFIIALVLLG